MLGGCEHHGQLEGVSGDTEPQVSAPCILFSGDTLFVGGVGKFFEGTPAQMVQNLYGVAGAAGAGSGKLPPGAIVCTGHEYAAPNLAFAAWVDGDNSALADKLRWVSAARSLLAPQATSVSIIAEECDFNPFMRVHCASILRRLAGMDEGILAAASAASDCEVHHAAALVKREVATLAGDSSSDKAVLVAAISLLRALKDADAHLKFA
jgi:hypothetical protein